MDAALLRETGDPKRVNQTCTEVVLRGVQATDLELGEALTHGKPNPGSQIPAGDLELGEAERVQGNTMRKNDQKEASEEYAPRRLKNFFFKNWFKKSCSN